MTPRRYLWNVLKLADINLNVLLLVDEHIQTLSRRAGIARRKGKRWACVFCALLNPVAKWLAGEEDHCERAAAKEGCIR